MGELTLWGERWKDEGRLPKERTEHTIKELDLGRRSERTADGMDDWASRTFPKQRLSYNDGWLRHSAAGTTGEVRWREKRWWEKGCSPTKAVECT